LKNFTIQRKREKIKTIKNNILVEIFKKLICWCRNISKGKKFAILFDLKENNITSNQF
jgi:hypothetical protein